MDEQHRYRFLETCTRFVAAITGRPAPDEFSEAHVWSMIPGLAGRRRSGVDLNTAAAQILPELASIIGIRPGASARTIAATLVRLLGDCPHSNEMLIDACEYLRDQVNGAFGQAPPKPPMPDLGF